MKGEQDSSCQSRVVRGQEPPDDQAVAMFIDWENFRIAAIDALGRGPDLSVLKKAAGRYGRLILARAYADWAQYPKDCELLFAQGIDPLFASTAGKNSADIRMAAECVEQTLSREGLHTVILVSGDRDFIPLIALLKSHGKQVIVIAVSGSFSPEMTYLPDRFLLYEQLVSAYIQPSGERMELIEGALDLLREAVQELRLPEVENSAPAIKAMLLRRCSGFEEEGLGFPRFEHFLYAAEYQGMLRVDATVWPQRIHPPDAAVSDFGDYLPSHEDWKWLIRYMRDMKGPRFERSILGDLKMAELGAARSAAKFIEAAKKSGVLLRFRQPRYNADEKKWWTYEALQLNEQNSRVQVYLGFDGIE